MEKIRPLLEQKFWILSVVALITVVTGWWMGAGRLSAKYTEREKVLDGLKVSKGNTPNKDWGDKMERIVKVKKERLEYSAKYLRDQQSDEKVRFWPASMEVRMRGVPFRNNIDIEGLEYYRQDYHGVTLPNVRKIVNPYDMKTGKGKCQLKIEVLPQVPRNQWDVFPPNSTEVWNAQLDVWLTSALLNAVASTNQTAKGIANAPIKVISLLELHSGNRKPGGIPVTGKSAAKPGGRQPQGGGLGGGQQETGKTARKVGDGLKNASTSINLVDEFGTEDPDKLYVNDDPKMPFKTRGFYLKVMMDRNKLPHFLAQLTSLKYPVEIVQVQQTTLDHSASGSKAGNQNSERPMGSPMGSTGGLPMPPMGRAFGTGVIELSSEEEIATQTFERALSQPEMSEVAIAGLMTIYTPKEDKGGKDGKPTKTQLKNETTPQTATTNSTTTSTNVVPGKKTPAASTEDSSIKNKLPAENNSRSNKPSDGKTSLPSTSEKQE